MCGPRLPQEGCSGSLMGTGWDLGNKAAALGETDVLEAVAVALHAHAVERMEHSVGAALFLVC